MRFEGASEASPAPGLLDAIANAEAIILCPSNPFISIGPILAIPGIREALQRRRDKVAAISPIVGGRALKGPAAKMMKSMQLRSSAAEVAKLYVDFCGVFVLDEVDRKQAAQVEALGHAAGSHQHHHARAAREKVSGASGGPRTGNSSVIFAILPVKSPQNAKQRLTGFLAVEQRETLARMLYRQTLAALLPGRGHRSRGSGHQRSAKSPNTRVNSGALVFEETRTGQPQRFRRRSVFARHGNGRIHGVAGPHRCPHRDARRFHATRGFAHAPA